VLSFEAFSKYLDGIGNTYEYINLY
jgi:hypothetical protein